MKNERMLAYQLAQKLDPEEIQNVAGGFLKHSSTYPTMQCGYPCDVESNWDI